MSERAEVNAASRTPGCGGAFREVCISEGVESSFTFWENREAGFAVFPACSRDMDLDLTYRLMRYLQAAGQRWF